MPVTTMTVSDTQNPFFRYISMNECRKRDTHKNRYNELLFRILF